MQIKIVDFESILFLQIFTIDTKFINFGYPPDNLGVAASTPKPPCVSHRT